MVSKDGTSGYWVYLKIPDFAIVWWLVCVYIWGVNLYKLAHIQNIHNQNLKLLLWKNLL